MDVPSPRARAPISGDFEGFYREHLGFVRHVVQRLGVVAAVDDVVQDTFLTAYRRRGSLRPEASAKAWLATIARRVAYRHRRTVTRNHRKAAALVLASTGPVSPDAARRYDAARFLERFLASLDPGKREVFVLSEVGELRTPEIAAELGLNANTVYTRLRVSRQMFAAAAEAEGLAEPTTVFTHARTADRPSRAEVQRTWALLLPRLHEGAVWPGLGLAATPRIVGGVASFVLALGLGTGAAFGIHRWAAPRDHDEASATSTPRQRDAAPVNDASLDATEASVEISTGSLLQPPEPRIHAPETERPRTRGRTHATGDRPPTSGRARPVRTDATDDVQAVPVQQDDGNADVELLERALLALERDPAEALALVDEHARRFPRSQLAEARSRLEVRALCKRDPERARARAAVLMREHPHSNIARIARDDCGDQASR